MCRLVVYEKWIQEIITGHLGEEQETGDCLVAQMPPFSTSENATYINSKATVRRILRIKGHHQEKFIPVESAYQIIPVSNHRRQGYFD